MRKLALLALLVITTLYISDATVASGSAFLAHVGSIGGVINAIDVEGHYAYIGEGLGMTVMDISNPDRPEVVGRTPAIGIIQEIVANGDYVYVADREVWAVDVSDPTNPEPVSTGIRANGSIRSMDIDGNLLFAGFFGPSGSFGGGLHIYDLTNPTALRQVGYLDAGGFPNDLAAAGRTVYYADDARGLVIIDVGVPAQPYELALIELDWPATPSAVEVVGDHLFTGYDDRFRVIDVSVPSSPVELGSVEARKGPGPGYRIEVVGNRAYYGGRGPGLLTIDVSDANVPKVLSHLIAKGDIEDFAASGDRVYMAIEESIDEGDGVWSVDMTDPTDPVDTSVYDVMDRLTDVVVKDMYAYVGDREEGLTVVDVSNPALPTAIGHYDTPGGERVEGIALNGNHLYLALDGDGLRVLDVSDPEKLTEVHAITGIRPGDVAFQAGYVYLTDPSDDFWILDASDPARPLPVASYENLGGQKMEVEGDLVYLVQDQLGMWILDISDPLNVTEIGSFDTGSGYAMDVAITGDYALLAVRDRYLLVLDVSDPGSISVVGEFRTNPSTVAVQGDLAYVAGLGKLQVVDIGNPSDPKLLDQFEILSAFFAEAHVAKDLVYLAGSSNSGLQIFGGRSVPVGNEIIFLPSILKQ